MSRHWQSQDMPDGVLSANNHYAILVTDKATPPPLASRPTRRKLHSLKAACRSWRLPGGAHIPVMSDLFVAAAVTCRLATLLKVARLAWPRKPDRLRATPSGRQPKLVAIPIASGEAP